MRALAVPAAGIALADQESPFSPSATVVAQGAATDVLEGSYDGGSNYYAVVTFSATLRFQTVNLGAATANGAVRALTHVRASSSDVIYLLGN